MNLGYPRPLARLSGVAELSLGLAIPRLVAGAAIAAALSACAGGLSGTVPSAQGARPAATSAGADATAQTVLRLKIPKHSRKAHYVSASTRSIVIIEGKVRLKPYNVRPFSKYCAPSEGSTFCTFRIGLRTGRQTLVINTYDGTGGTGHLLSQGRVTQLIRPGLNVIPVTLDGVVASIVVALQGASPPAGAAVSVPLTVMGEDADGNVIVGAGSFTNPITLSSSDTSGALTVPTVPITKPYQSVSATYNGQSIVSASIGATATGVPTQNVTAATIAPTMNAVADFLVPGFRTKPFELPTAVVTGPDGKIWAAVAPAFYGILQITTAGAQTFYQAGQAPSTNLPFATINGLAAGSDGNVWYADQSDVGFITPAGVATDYPLTGAGLCPSPSAHRLVAAAPSDGGLWFTIQCKGDSQIGHVTRNGTFSFFNLTSFTGAQAVVLGKDGNLYVAGSITATADGSVAQAIVSGSMVTTVNVLDISSLSGVSFVGLVQSADGDLWTSTGACAPSAFVRLHPAATFTATTIQAFLTTAGCASPYFMTAASDGTLWAANFAHPTATRIIPGIYPAAPSQSDVTLPTPVSVPGNEADVTVGPDGNIYFADESSGVIGSAADIPKLAY